MRLSEEQQQMILEGVKNDVDYKDIAKQVGVNHQTVANFMWRRIASKFHESQHAQAIDN